MMSAGTSVWKSKRGTPLLGCRCVFINDEQYGYNVRDELISAGEVSYNYDDIGIYAPTSVSEVGNRTTAEGKTYTANNLNQYIAIDDFVPQYDADGNQTLIKTETGIWSVVYNAENRPIRWQSGDTVITMAFDRMGRRVEMRTVTPTSDLLQRFVYKDFLCIQQLRGPDNVPYQSYVWDPTEPIATRPLLLRGASGASFYYFHDANKNVAGLTDATRARSLAYAYSPYGAPTLLPTSTLPLDNPFQFSSEVHDAPLALTYYNYRHYQSLIGRWNSRDLLGENSCSNLFVLCNNNPITSVDNRGLATVRITTNDGNTQTYVNRPKKDIIDSISNTPNHSIVSIEITGHGSPSSIEMFDGGQGLVCIQDPTDPTNWTVCFTDDASSFSDLLKDKLACSATIDLDGCNTAWEGDIFIGKSFGCRSKAKQKSIVMPPDFQSIAETLSNELPDATVRGHSDYRMGIDSQRYFNLFRDIVFRDPDVSYKGGNKQ